MYKYLTFPNVNFPVKKRVYSCNIHVAYHLDLSAQPLSYLSSLTGEYLHVPLW